VEVVVIIHLFHRALDDAYDADQIVTMVEEGLDLDHDDIPVQPSFHLLDQCRYFHCWAEILCLSRADQRTALDLFVHRFAILDLNLAVDNHCLSNFDYYHFVNAPAQLQMVVLVMP
jgi:hypothetical protein